MQRTTHVRGGELVLALLGAGDVAGLPELLLATPAEAEVVAGTGAEAFLIPWRAVVTLAQAAPELHIAIERELARELTLLRTRILALAFSTLERRLAALLLEIESLARRTPTVRLTQALLADAIGASRPKLNRCLKDMERRGVIALRPGGRPVICDRDALVRLL